MTRRRRFDGSKMHLDGLTTLWERDFQKPGRSEALGIHCMVATSHPLATWTALDILRDGGNAVDAAVAAAAVLGVVEPTQTGLGGDCFALIYQARTGNVRALNASGPAPAAANLADYLATGLTRMPMKSVLSWTVPGCVDGWWRMLAGWGTE